MATRNEKIRAKRRLEMQKRAAELAAARKNVTTTMENIKKTAEITGTVIHAREEKKKEMLQEQQAVAAQRTKEEEIKEEIVETEDKQVAADRTAAVVAAEDEAQAAETVAETETGTAPLTTAAGIASKAAKTPEEPPVFEYDKPAVEMSAEEFKVLSSEKQALWGEQVGVEATAEAESIAKTDVQRVDAEEQYWKHRDDYRSTWKTEPSMLSKATAYLTKKDSDKPASRRGEWSQKYFYNNDLDAFRKDVDNSFNSLASGTVEHVGINTTDKGDLNTADITLNGGRNLSINIKTGRVDGISQCSKDEIKSVSSLLGKMGVRTLDTSSFKADKTALIDATAESRVAYKDGTSVMQRAFSNKDRPPELSGLSKTENIDFQKSTKQHEGQLKASRAAEKTAATAGKSPRPGDEAGIDTSDMSANRPTQRP